MFGNDCTIASQPSFVRPATIERQWRVVLALTIGLAANLSAAADPPRFGKEEEILNYDTSNRLWRDESGILLDIATTPDGRYVVTASDAIVVWDHANRRVQSSQRIKTTCVAIAPNGRVLATGHPDGVVRVWNLVNGNLQNPPAEMEAHLGLVTALAMPKETIVVTGGEDGALSCWSRERGDWANHWGPRKQPHRKAISALAALLTQDDPDNPRFLVASGHEDGMIVLWDEKGDAHKWEQGSRRYLKAADDISIGSLVFAPGAEKLIAAAKKDREPKFWHVRSGKPIGYQWKSGADQKKHSAGLRALALTPNGQQLASADYDGAICAWDVEGAVFEASPKGNIIRQVANLQGHDGWVNAVEFLKSGKLVSAGQDRTLRLWHVPQ